MEASISAASMVIAVSQYSVSPIMLTKQSFSFNDISGGGGGGNRGGGGGFGGGGFGGFGGGGLVAVVAAAAAVVWASAC